VIAWLEALHPRGSMTLDYAIGLLVTAALLVYLTYALLRPEKF
jgi:K+-transporting ATPase KdpF subunit